MRIVLVLLATIMVMALCYAVQGQEVEGLYEAPLILDCRYATTMNGRIERCKFGPEVEQVGCPLGELYICTRKYGYRTCDCYPE